MFMQEVRSELYERKTIRNLPLGIQDDVIREAEETILRYYILTPKESVKNELSDE